MISINSETVEVSPISRFIARLHSLYRFIAESMLKASWSASHYILVLHAIMVSSMLMLLWRCHDIISILLLGLVARRHCN